MNNNNYSLFINRYVNELFSIGLRIEAPEANYLNFSNDLDSNWYEGFCSEGQVQKHNTEFKNRPYGINCCILILNWDKDGQAYYVWAKLSQVRNEALDTSVYALAAVHLVGLSRIKWKDEEKEAILDVHKSETKQTPSKSKTTVCSQQRNRRKAGAIKVY